MNSNLKVRIALSLTSKSAEKMVSDGLEIMSGKLLDRPDMLELRLDYIPPGELNSSNISFMIRSLKPTPLIVTVRHRDEAPPGDKDAGFKGTEKERRTIFEEAISNGVDFIDVEYKRFIDVDLEGSETRLLLSKHDFNGTPSMHKLNELYHDMHKFRRDAVIKIATTYTCKQDNKHILDLIKKYAPNGNLVALAMGEGGRDTRVRGPLLGGLWTYACKDDYSSAAPGQMTVEDIRKSMNIAIKYL